MKTTPFHIALDHASLSGERRSTGGLPLILLHGFGGSRHDWEPLISALPSALGTIAYDQRGFGDSIGEPGHAFAHADDLLAVLDTLSIERADICGISLGGGTAISFALAHPERVRRLVLISPLMVGWSWSSEWIDLWKQVGRAARSGDMAIARDLWWQHPLFATTRASAAAPRLRAAIDAFHGDQWVQDDQRPEPPDADRISSLKVPTLLLTGARDTQDFRLIADLIATTAPGVTRIDHPDAGHLLNLEIPDTIAGEIAAFLHA